MSRPGAYVQLPYGGGWPQMASRGVSHAALGPAAVRAVLLSDSAAQVSLLKKRELTTRLHQELSGWGRALRNELVFLLS